jgi:hypothetical protein
MMLHPELVKSDGLGLRYRVVYAWGQDNDGNWGHLDFYSAPRICHMLEEAWWNCSADVCVIECSQYNFARDAKAFTYYLVHTHRESGDKYVKILVGHDKEAARMALVMMAGDAL